MILLANSLQVNQGSAALAPDHLRKEYQRSFRNGKASNATDHNQVLSASGNGPLEARKNNQATQAKNAQDRDATDERASFAPIPNDISS
jgi:hypothetical protein